MSKERTADYIVYTDGSCLGNPGGRGGIGVVIVDTETGEITEISKGFRCTTNNRMEMSAIIEGLLNTSEGSSIDLYTDSEYCRKTIEGSYSVGKNEDLWEDLFSLVRKRSVRVFSVKGHSGDPLNERCDELANEASHGDHLVEDDGYFGGYREAPAVDHSFGGVFPPGGSMAVRIDVAEDLNGKIPEIGNAKEYALAHGIKPECALLIRAFYKKSNHNFRSYAELKTGGIDSLSRKKVPEMLLSFSQPEQIQDILASILDEKECASALRWYMRGLTLSDSIRKVLVDKEISLNSTSSRKNRGWY